MKHKNLISICVFGVVAWIPWGHDYCDVDKTFMFVNDILREGCSKPSPTAPSNSRRKVVGHGKFRPGPS